MTLYRTLHLLFFTCIFFTSSIFTSEIVSKDRPIDVVYLWVDGNDPDWLANKEFYEEIEGVDNPIKKDGIQVNRFCDHDELKYSLRSILKNIPFFNHIYIVTMNQRPFWLLDHPKITIVDHKEIFKDPAQLPTFNSQALECHLHRIPNLAEHFIYFNDDVFVGQPLSESDFFTDGGQIKILFEEGYTVSEDPVVQASLYRRAWVNSNVLLDYYFTPESRHRLCHAPFALRKSWIEEIEEHFPFVFEENSAQRFRAPTNYNVTNGLFQYIWYYQDRAVIGDLTNKMASIFNDNSFESNKYVLENLVDFPRQTFCLQDCMIGNSEKSCQLLKNFMQFMFPDPAPWEISTIDIN